MPHMAWFEHHGKIFPICGPLLFFSSMLWIDHRQPGCLCLAFLRSPQHRWPVVIMSTGMVAGAFSSTGNSRDNQSEVPVSGGVPDVCYPLFLPGFDPIPWPAGRSNASFRHASARSPGKIVGEPGCMRHLGSPTKHLLGCQIQDLLPPARLTGISCHRAVRRISLGSGPEIRHYRLEASSLNDWRGLAVGLLVYSTM
jgi:hypothetical protein